MKIQSKHIAFVFGQRRKISIFLSSELLHVVYKFLYMYPCELSVSGLALSNTTFSLALISP